MAGLNTNALIRIIIGWGAGVAILLLLLSTVLLLLLSTEQLLACVLRIARAYCVLGLVSGLRIAYWACVLRIVVCELPCVLRIVHIGPLRDTNSTPSEVALDLKAMPEAYEPWSIAMPVEPIFSLTQPPYPNSQPKP